MALAIFLIVDSVVPRFVFSFVSTYNILSVSFSRWQVVLSQDEYTNDDSLTLMITNLCY